MHSVLLTIHCLAALAPVVLPWQGTIPPKPIVSPATDSPFPPHHIAGNLYYVGSKQLASYLIKTTKGHILINSGFAETVPLIKASVEKLGFRFKDIKILLDSHAHDDHVAGNALVRKLSGSKVYVMGGDEEIVRTGGRGDFQYTTKWEPCPVDKVLHDGDIASLGDATLTAHKTPGHTRGCTTWTMTVIEKGKPLRAVIIGSPNVNPGYKLVNNAKYPSIAEDYRRCFRLLKTFPCDLFLGAHGNYYNLEEKYARLQKHPSTNPFIDPIGYRKYVDYREQAFFAELKKQSSTNTNLR